MKTTPQPDAAKMTPTPYSLSADKHNGDTETYPISMGPSLTWSDPATGMEWFIARFEDCLPDGQKEADIVDKLNSHARLLAENAALVQALPLAINAADCFKKAVRLLEESTGQYVNSASFYALSENLESARAVLGRSNF